ncbi:MAG: hypothetical protein M3340_06445 [Actinomycetota bacterium]|nr:hypothetical protein [Actinomycetota bacterium]
MADIDERIGRIREEFDSLLLTARRRLLAGAPVERVQGYYVTLAFSIVEDAEARAVLASGDDSALEALAEHATRLAELHAELAAEFSG